MPAAKPLVVVTGAPASGKSTAVRALREHWPTLRHFGIRRFLGDEIERGTELGLRALDLSSRLRWLPDPFVMEAFAGWLDDHRGAAGGWLVESFPRNRSQVRLLRALLARRDLSISSVLLFEAPDEVLFARARARTICLTCDGTIADVEAVPDARCPGCGTQLVRRKDDRPEVLLDRIQAHRASVPDLLEAYRPETPVCRIDGSRSILDVRRQAIAAVEPCWSPERSIPAAREGLSLRASGGR